jgi:hypothetical protein
MVKEIIGSVSQSALHSDEATKSFTSTGSIVLLKDAIEWPKELIQQFIEAKSQVGANFILIVRISNGKDGDDSIASADLSDDVRDSELTWTELADPADDSSIASEEINTSSDRYDDSIWNKFISEEVENSIRLEAIEAVGKIGDVSTIPTLLKC